MEACMNIKQAEIWLVTFYPTIGQEIGKTRPAVVVNDNQAGKLKLRTVVPVTDWKDAYSNYPWMIKVTPDSANGLSKESAIDCFQIKNLSTDRFVKQIGFVENVVEIHGKIVKTLNLRYRLA